MKRISLSKEHDKARDWDEQSLKMHQQKKDQRRQVMAHLCWKRKNGPILQVGENTFLNPDAEPETRKKIKKQKNEKKNT